jgi:putative flavoprotein involved in K+ transport
MVEKIETIIIGGGQAGLATSYHLGKLGHPHFILEQAAQPANAWRNGRWDSFSLLTPNWSIQIPGAEYQGDDPNGFMTRAEIISYFEKYIDRFCLPVRYGVLVTAVEKLEDGRGYLVRTNEKEYQTPHIVMATGLYQSPKIPFFSTNIPRRVVQIHSGQYRNPQLLPPGAVMVVGSGQSGCQIAEELYLGGYKVYLCTGHAGRIPRRYRGKGAYEWLNLSGYLDRTADMLPSPQARFAGNPHIAEAHAGHSNNLHQLARGGVILLGHLAYAGGDNLQLAADLKDNLAIADNFERRFARMVDEFVIKANIEAPLEPLAELNDGYEAGEPVSLSLKKEGIKTIIWALGYNFDFSMVKLPILDGEGYPVQQRGVTNYPGLYFVGLPWLTKQKSGLMLGVGEDAGYIASKIAQKEPVCT